MSKKAKPLSYLIALLLPLCLLTLFPGCSKTGPAGATGAIGAQGPAGPTGSQGPQGNANVLVDTLTLINSQWAWNSQYSLETAPGGFTEYFTRYKDVADNAVTQGILDSGEVMVFFNPDPLVNSDQWAPLPFEFTDGSGEFNYVVAFETSAKQVEMEYFFVQTGTVNPPNLYNYNIPTYKFKIIVTSATISTTMQMAGIDKRNYNAVSNFLSLADQGHGDLPFSAGAGRN